MFLLNVAGDMNLGSGPPKSVAAYLATLRNLVAWLTTQPEDDDNR